MDDLLIRGATLIDGTGGAPRSVDVAVRDGLISAVEARRTETAVREIDGTGRVLAPGFIDIHTHSDFTLPLNPMAEAKIRQGVTTEVVGNCGFSVAPALPGKAELLAHYLSASAPWLPFTETDFAGYMAAWPGIAVNTVMQVGHNTLRLMAMGMKNRAPGDSELLHMQEMLAEALEAGALGMSSGLFTPPGDQRHPLCPEQGTRHGGMVEEAARPQIRAPGLGRPGQQDGAHRLVGADPGPGLSKHLSRSQADLSRRAQRGGRPHVRG